MDERNPTQLQSPRYSHVSTYWVTTTWHDRAYQQSSFTKWAVIPRGRTNQVAKEKDHLDVLQPYTGLGHAKTYILVTLHKVLLGTRTRLGWS